MKIKEAIKLNNLGQFVRDDEPEEKFGVYIDGKLHNAYWGERPAKDVADYMQRLHPEKTITVKAIFGEENAIDEDDVTEVTPALQPGSKIRTKKHSVEGEVAKIENGVVFFKLPDGRMMKTSERNVVPVEKLEDGLPGGFSNSDYTPGSRGVGLRLMPSPNLCKTCHGKGWVPQGTDQIERNIKVECPGCKGSGSIATEGSMGGINRSAPSNDVSYEKVLDEVMDKYMQTHSGHQGEERRADPKPEPVPGLNREKAEKIAKAMNIRLNDTVYVYKLAKSTIKLDDVPPTVRMAVYNLVQHMPIDQRGVLRPEVLNKLRNIVMEHELQEEVKKLEQVFKESDPCWDGYKQIGMKKKGGKKVPNCVPKK